MDWTQIALLLGVLLVPSVIAIGVWMMLGLLFPQKAAQAQQQLPNIVLSVVLATIGSLLTTTATTDISAIVPDTVQPVFKFLSLLFAPNLFMASLYLGLSGFMPELGQRAMSGLQTMIAGVFLLSVAGAIITALTGMLGTPAPPIDDGTIIALIGLL